MKRAALAVMLLVTAAEAAPVKPPAGWTTDPAAAVSLSKQLGEMPHFGGLGTSPTTEVYRAPAGGALYVTRIFAAAKPEERDRAVTIELGEIDAAMRRAGANAVPDSKLGQPRTIPDLKLLEGRSSWRDKTTGVATVSRMILAADAKQVVAVTGECVLAGDAAAAVVTACNAALASLDPEIPVESRVALNLVAAPQPTTATGSGTTGPAVTSPAGPSMLEGGDRPALPPMTIPQAPREPDRRPVYIGLGLVLLAILFYWNRKNREKLERAYEERAAEGKGGKPDSGDDKPAKPTRARDGDADDLHAAASGEGETGGTKEKE